jgi:hypothetical protein
MTKEDKIGVIPIDKESPIQAGSMSSRPIAASAGMAMRPAKNQASITLGISKL